MCSTVMKGLRFADTQESSFEAWKRSQMGCSAMFCDRFDDIEDSDFQASKLSNMCSAALLGGLYADIHEFCFQAAKRSDLVCVEQQWGLFADCHELHFRSRKIQIIAVPSCKCVDLLMIKNSFSGCETLKNVQCCPAMRLIC